MLVEQIYTDNAWRNFNYLVACPDTGQALAIDPLEHEKCLAAAKRLGWDIVKVLNTHEHGDHTGGNTPMIAATGAELLAHHGAKNKIPNVDVGLQAGDIITIGKTVQLEVLDTPGHTMSHVCLLSHTEEPALFSGDTLFNAGAGNCHNGGHPEELYETFSNQLSTLPDNTRIFPGHDYIANNLEFTLNREPDNIQAGEFLAIVSKQDPHQAIITTLSIEKEINSFFRLENPSIIGTLRQEFSALPDTPNPREVFLRLRELRNKW